MYRYGEEVRPVDVSTVTLRYKDGDGTGERTFEVYHTHHGPVTHAIDGKWTATKINWDPVNALIQSFTRTKLENYAEFREMMNIRTNSSNNTVFADSEGNIAYFHGNFVPRRDPRFDYSRPVDGSDPAAVHAAVRAARDGGVPHLVEARLAGEALEAEVRQADVVLDCSDNFDTRFAVNAASRRHGIPLVSGAAIRWDGQVGVFNRTAADPCYRCLYATAGEDEQRGQACADGVHATDPLQGRVRAVARPRRARRRLSLPNRSGFRQRWN